MSIVLQATDSCFRCRPIGSIEHEGWCLTNGDAVDRILYDPHIRAAVAGLDHGSQGKSLGMGKTFVVWLHSLVDHGQKQS